MKKLKSILLSALLVITAFRSDAQLNAGAQGVFIKSGTMFSSEGLFIVPSGDISITANSLTKRSLAVSGPHINGIKRLYEFAKPVSFQGHLGMYYHDEELNGNNLNALKLALSASPSTHYKEYTVLIESEVNLAEKSIGHSEVKMPFLSGITALTPFSIAGSPGMLIPNNFLTPNGDGINDLWVIKGIEHFPDNELKVFDRTGRIVHSAIGYKNDWDGTLGGRPLAEDSYYYTLFFNSGQQKITGFISIVKKE